MCSWSIFRFCLLFNNNCVIELDGYVGSGHVRELANQIIQIRSGQTSVEGEAHGATIGIEFILQSAEGVGRAASIVRCAVKD